MFTAIVGSKIEYNLTPIWKVNFNVNYNSLFNTIGMSGGIRYLICNSSRHRIG